MRHPAVKAATRRADALLESLSPEGRAAVSAYRGASDAVLAAAVGPLEEVLAARAGGATGSRVAAWEAEGVALLGPLHAAAGRGGGG